MSKEPANCSSGLLSLFFGPFTSYLLRPPRPTNASARLSTPRDSISAERAENRSCGAQEDADQERHYADPALAHGASLQNLIDEAHNPVQAAPSASAVSVADELKKLAELNQAGALTDEEFAAAKQQLISGS